MHPATKTVLAASIDRVLRCLGQHGRAGTAETPDRVATAWVDTWASGYDQDPAKILKTFEDGAEDYDEVILVSDIPIYSHCEHHMAPFFGVAHIGYIPDKRIVGLSKLVRIADIFARRLQVQERMTRQICDAISENLKPKAVGVIVQCRHMCMESRGVRTPGTSTTTSALAGAFMKDASAKAEFFSLVQNRGAIK